MMLTEKKQILSKGFDTYLIVIYVLLVIIGWFTIYSSSYDANDSFSLFNTDKAYSRQFIWILVSMALAVVLLLMEEFIRIMRSISTTPVCFLSFLCCFLVPKSPVPRRGLKSVVLVFNLLSLLNLQRH